MDIYGKIFSFLCWCTKTYCIKPFLVQGSGLRAKNDKGSTDFVNHLGIVDYVNSIKKKNDVVSEKLTYKLKGIDDVRTIILIETIVCCS